MEWIIYHWKKMQMGIHCINTVHWINWSSRAPLTSRIPSPLHQFTWYRRYKYITEHIPLPCTFPHAGAGTFFCHPDSDSDLGIGARSRVVLLVIPQVAYSVELRVLYTYTFFVPRPASIHVSPLLKLLKTNTNTIAKKSVSRLSALFMHIGHIEQKLNKTKKTSE